LSGCSEIVIEDDVSNIGDYTFYGCTGLEELVMPVSVKICNSKYTFGNCTNIEKVTLTKGTGIAQDYDTSTSSSATNTYYGYTPWYLSGCSEIVIEDGVINIGINTFKNCSNVKDVYFMGDLAGWCAVSFDDCYANPMCYADNLYIDGKLLGSEIDIPNDVTSIGSYTFYNLSGVTSISIPDSVKSIGEEAFSNTDYYKDTNNWDNNVLYIDNHLIKANTGLSGEYTIKNGTIGVASKAFDNCSKLTGIYIPNSFTYVSINAFLNCSKLQSVYYAGTIADWCNIEFENFYANPKCYASNIYIDGMALTGDLKIPNGVTNIGGYAFSNFKELTSITFSDSVTNIGNGSFYGCTGFTSLTIGDNVKSIGDYAFYNCNKINTVTVPVSVTSVGTSAFGNCSEIKNTYYIDTISKWNDISIESGNDYFTKFVIYEYNIERPYYSSGVCGDNLTYILYTDGELVISGTGDMTDYMNSSYVPWYKYSSLIKSITFDGAITSIGSYSFYGCSSLTSVTILDSVTTIGRYAFYQCDSLTEVNIKDIFAWCNISFGNDNFFHYYANPLYYAKTLKLNGEAVTDLVIPDGITEIKDSAFRGCTSLTSVTIPDSVTTIGDYAFHGCDSLTSVIIGDSVTTIGDSAFDNCTGLKELTMPISADIHYYNYWVSVSNYTNTSFNNCVNIEKVTLTKGSGVQQDYSTENLSDSNYYKQTPWSISSNIKEIIIEDGVTTIGDNAFKGCGVANISIPESVTTIGDCAFSSCYSLTSITIPESVTTIGNYAFSSCYSLTTIIVDINNQYYSSDEHGVLFNKDKSELIQYPRGNIRTSYTIPSSVTVIDDYAFYYCTNLTDVIIPDDVTIIGDNTFEKCTSLTNIVIPDSVTSIGTSAFSGCTKLTDVKISGGITNVSDSTFSGCTSLINVTIPDGVTSIDSSAFEGCTGITNVTIPDSVTSIGGSAFDGCTKISATYYTGVPAQWSKISIGSNNTYLTKNIVYDCNSIRPRKDAGTCGENVQWTLYTDGELVISGTGSMDNYSSESLAPWNTYKALIKTVKVEDEVTGIGNYAFNGCSSIEKIIIPESLQNIGDFASLACSNLTDIYYSGTETDWNLIIIGSANGYINNATKHFEHVHNYKATTAVQSSCLVTGKIKYECDCSSISKFEETSLSGHTEGNWTITKQATTSVTGERVKKCTVCSVVLESEVIPKLDPVCNYLKWRVSGDYIVITGFYSGLSGDVVLPESINGYPVKEIDEAAFINSKITSIQIPLGVTRIGQCAFSYCSNLKSVTIPWGVNTIDPSAFVGCTNLEEIKIYDDYYKEYTHDGLFFKTDDKGVLFWTDYNGGTNETVLFYAPAKAVGKSYTIPDYATSAEDSAFADCKDFSLTLSDNFDMEYDSLFFKYLSVNEFIASENCANFSTIDGVLYNKDATKLVKYPVDSNKQIYVVPDSVTNIASDSAFYVMEEEQEIIMMYNLSNSFSNIIKTPAHLTVHIPSKNISINKLLVGPSHYCVAGYSQAEIDAGNSLVSEEIAEWTDYWNEIRYEMSSGSKEYQMMYNYITCMKNAYGTFEACEEDHTNPYPFSSVISTVKATCTEDGYNTYECSECGYYFEVVIKSTGHNYKSIVIEPTCTANGYTKYICLNCRKSYKDNTTEKVGHSYVSKVTEPTCTMQGYTTYTCNCGDSYVEDYVNATGHSYEEVVTVPTCVDRGYTTYTCDCGYSYIGDYVSATGHNYTSEITISATHTTTGINTFTCNCGDTYTETINKLTEHIYEAVVTPSTCTEGGYTTYTCICGDSYIGDRVSASGHTNSDVVEENYVASTCTKNGSKDNVTYCTVCNVETSRETTVVPATGHNYVNGKCENCGENDVYYYNGTFHIQSPSTTSIRHKDGIKLHAKVEGTAPAGSYVKWTASNSNFKTEEINSGNSFKIISDKNGTTTFTATLFSAEGEVLATDTIEMKSKAGFFDKIGSFFRSIFGGTKVHEN
jgi:hypothetical protein